MPNPEHPFSYVINVGSLKIGIVVGLLIAFGMWRLRIHRSVALGTVALIASAVGSVSWMPAALAALLIIGICGHFQNRNYDGLLTITQLASIFVRSTLDWLIGYRWGVRGLLVFSLLALGGLYQAPGISLPMLVLLATQTALMWWLSKHLKDARFDTDEDARLLHGLCSGVVQLLGRADQFLGHAWQAYRTVMLIAGVFVIHALHKLSGMSGMYVLIWIEVLTITWGAARDPWSSRL
jgi:hypothetical protein